MITADKARRSEHHISMAPEQAEGKPVDARADVFAFGIVLYEMVCGQRPFRGDTTLAMLANILQATPEPPRHLRRDLPKLLEQLILRCLEKNPDARFDSGWELREAFRGLEQRTTASSVRALRATLIATLAMNTSAQPCTPGVGIRPPHAWNGSSAPPCQKSRS